MFYHSGTMLVSCPALLLHPREKLGERAVLLGGYECQNEYVLHFHHLILTVDDVYRW